jgi:hypothetical protein
VSIDIVGGHQKDLGAVRNRVQVDVQKPVGRKSTVVVVVAFVRVTLGEYWDDTKKK